MTPRLAVDSLSVRIGGLAALDGVGLAVESGERIGLIGANGSGKSTLFNAITGAAAIDGGCVRLDGEDLTGAPPHRLSWAGVARTFQTPRVFRRMSVVDNVRPTHGPSNERRVSELLERAGIAARSKDLADDLTLAELRRLEIVRAAAGNPRVLLFDEPTAGLSQDEAREAVALIKDATPGDAAVIVIEHRLDALDELATRVVVLNRGLKIADGPLAELRRSADIREAYLGRMQ